MTTHKVVPREPTPEMLAARPPLSMAEASVVRIWRAMYDAAPAVQDAPPLTIDKMLLRDGLYGVSDTNRPEALVPIVVIGGTAYALHREPIPLCHWGWLETAVVCGGPILPLSGDGRASMPLPAPAVQDAPPPRDEAAMDVAYEKWRFVEAMEHRPSLRLAFYGGWKAAPAVADAPPLTVEDADGMHHLTERGHDVMSRALLRSVKVKARPAPQEDAPFDLVAFALQRIAASNAVRDDIRITIRAAIAALAEKDAALRSAEKTMGMLATMILQEQHDELREWACSVKVTFPDGAPYVAALGSEKGATE